MAAEHGVGAGHLDHSIHPGQTFDFGAVQSRGIAHQINFREHLLGAGYLMNFRGDAGDGAQVFENAGGFRGITAQLRVEDDNHDLKNAI